MSTTKDQWLQVCEVLACELTRELGNPKAIRGTVENLRIRNSFAESCFTKALVLPMIDRCVTRFLTRSFSSSRYEVFSSLRCEGFNTPMYLPESDQSGFSSHSRSNSYHPGDKSGRRSSSRRSPDFCVRHPKLRMVGEVKYVDVKSKRVSDQVIRELQDYLSVASEPSSDWGHDFGFGLVYNFKGDEPRIPKIEMAAWESDCTYVLSLQ